jgi:hypothetical protein
MQTPAPPGNPKLMVMVYTLEVKADGVWWPDERTRKAEFEK